MKKTRKLRNTTRQLFLLSFFENKGADYEAKEVNGFYLVKHVSPFNSEVVTVDLYTKETFEEYKSRAK